MFDFNSNSISRHRSYRKFKVCRFEQKTYYFNLRTGDFCCPFWTVFHKTRTSLCFNSFNLQNNQNNVKIGKSALGPRPTFNRTTYWSSLTLHLAFLSTSFDWHELNEFWTWCFFKNFGTSQRPFGTSIFPVKTLSFFILNSDGVRPALRSWGKNWVGCSLSKPLSLTFARLFLLFKVSIIEPENTFLMFHVAVFVTRQKGPLE